MAREDGRTVRAREREEWMRELVAEYERGDETQREFCERYGMSVSSLQWGKRELKRRVRRPEAVSVEPSSFLAVDVVGEAGRDASDVDCYELALESGAILRIPPSFDAVSLERLLGVLRGC